VVPADGQHADRPFVTKYGLEVHRHGAGRLRHPLRHARILSGIVHEMRFAAEKGGRRSRGLRPDDDANRRGALKAVIGRHDQGALAIRLEQGREAAAGDRAGGRADDVPGDLGIGRP
jgi:hypothetical protein